MDVTLVNSLEHYALMICKMLKKKKIQNFSNVNNKIQDEEHKLKPSDKNNKYDDTGVTKSQ